MLTQYSLQQKAKKGNEVEKNILHNVWGEARGGETTAIMGASGTRKYRSIKHQAPVVCYRSLTSMLLFTRTMQVPERLVCSTCLLVAQAPMVASSLVQTFVLETLSLIPPSPVFATCLPLLLRKIPCIHHRRLVRHSHFRLA